MAKPTERGVTIATDEGELVLEGLYLGSPDADSGAVIAPPHPLYGGSMDSPVVNEIAHACWQAGLASLRFNWRGVGASAGSPSGSPRAMDADFAAAARHLAETVPGPLLAAGYSAGAAAAVRAAAGHPRVERLLLVAPPAAWLDRDALAGFRGPLLLLTGERDELAPAHELEVLAGALPAASLRVIGDADHFFGAGLAGLARAIAGWL